MADCCAEISSRLAALEAAVAAIPRVNKQEIIDESVQKTLPLAAGLVVREVTPVKQAVGIVSDGLYALKGQVFNLSVGVGKAIDTANNSLKTALNAVGVSNSALSKAEVVAGRLAGLLELVFSLAASVATLEVLGGRIDGLEREINALENDFSRLLSIATTIKERAERAITIANQAQGTANQAQGTANQAQGKAEQAQGTANQAQGTANQAQGTANQAQGKAEQAQGTANQAQSKAEQAQGTANQAQGKAEQALGTAKQAQSKAEQAQGTANQAQGKAEQALGTAKQAQSKAEQAQGTANQAQGKAEQALGTAKQAQSKAEQAQKTAENAQGTADRAQGKAEQAQKTAENAQGKADRAQGTANDGLLKAIGALTIGGIALSLIQGLANRAGIPGPPGPRGFPGRNGINGRDGINGKNGINGRDGRDGIDVNPADLASLRTLIVQQHSQTRSFVAGVGNGINIKLGPQLPGGISTFLGIFFQGFNKLTEWMQLDRVLNIVNFVMTLQMIYFMCDSLKLVTLQMIADGLSVIGITDKDGNTLNLEKILENSIEDILKQILGVEELEGFKKEWKALNRIYQAASNLLFAIQNMMFSVLTALEIIGSWQASIGNALKKYLVVGQNAFAWLNPNPNFHNQFFTFLGNALNIVSSIDFVAQSILQGRQAVDSFGKQQEDLTKSMAEAADGFKPPAHKATTDAANKSATHSTAVIPSIEDIGGIQ